MAEILGVLAQMSRGTVIEEINAEFGSILDSVRKDGGEGELTVKIKVKGASWTHEGDLTEVSISHSMASKRPKRKIGASTFFVTREGELTRNNPEQAEMFGDLAETRTK